MILLRMIGRTLPDYFGAVDVNRLAQLFDLRRDRDHALQAIERMEKSAADVSSLSSMLDLLMMEHVTKSGELKIVARCSYPLTGIACVARTGNSRRSRTASSSSSGGQPLTSFAASKFAVATAS